MEKYKKVQLQQKCQQHQSSTRMTLLNSEECA